MEPIMNKKIFKYKCFAFLFAVSLIIAPIISFAGDAVKQIKLAELNTLLESNKGKVVILDLWATWCPPCRKEIFSYRDRPISVVTRVIAVRSGIFSVGAPEVVPPF